MDEMNGEITMW